jgi:putative ABC transport system permease protein
VEAEVKRLLTVRHGDEDFSVTTQEAMLDVFGKVMDVITMAVGAIASISLLVGATGILTMMWIAVGERTGEIGPRSRWGHPRAGQALPRRGVALATAGRTLHALAWASAPSCTSRFRLPVETPPGSVLAGLVVSMLTGIVRGWLWLAARPSTHQRSAE